MLNNLWDLSLGVCGWVGQVRVWWIWSGGSSSQCVEASLGVPLLISQDGYGPVQILQHGVQPFGSWGTSLIGRENGTRRQFRCMRSFGIDTLSWVG